MFGKYKLPLFIIVLVLVLGLAGFLLKGNFSKTKEQLPAPTTIAQPVSPTEVPLTSQNADTTLDQTDKAIGDSLNQLDNDTKSLDQIDQTADNSTGL